MTKQFMVTFMPNEQRIIGVEIEAKIHKTSWNNETYEFVPGTNCEPQLLQKLIVLEN